MSEPTRVQATCPGDVEDSYPLTPLQHGMLLDWLRGTSPGADVEQLVIDLEPEVDTAALVRAWGLVAAREPVLRTRFEWRERDVPVQQVLRDVGLSVATRDLDADDTSLRVFLAEDRALGIDLGVAPLWRITLLRRGATHTTLVWTYSHALLDNAFAFVLDDVERAGVAVRANQPPCFEPRRPYRDHCAWLAEHLEKTRADAKSFFARMLDGFTTPNSLEAIARKAPPAANASERVRAFALSRAESDALRSLRQDGIGVSVVCEAVWALVLAAFSGTDDVVFGVTRSCRRTGAEGASTMVGLLINTLPVRAKVDPSRPLMDWLRELREQQIAVRPFEHTALVDAASASPVPSGTPLFETVVVYNDAHPNARMRARGTPWTRRSLELHDQMTFPCALMGYGDDDLHFRIELDPTRVDVAAADRMASLAKRIFEAIARDPRCTVGDLPRLPEADIQTLASWQGAEAPIHGDPCVHRQIAAQARATPERTALIHRGVAATFSELEARASAVAARLSAMGVGRGALVGVFLGRSIDTVATLLGILKVGAAYVPMDPTYPAERIVMMIEDSKAKAIVTASHLRGTLPPTDTPVLEVDGVPPAPDFFEDEGVNGDDLAYVIFTSGSTGRPKGTLIRHRNVTALFTGMDQASFAASAPDRRVWLAVTSISFDISVLELLWTLARGFTVVVQDAMGERQRKMDFSLFYFAAEARSRGADSYRLLLEGARFADSHDFAAVWTPERHFHPFGGLYPNPAVTSAALAAVTKRVAIRAGSVVLPLHNPLRCAEDWAVVDNLSNGRVGLSFASGWHSMDFALMPDAYADRRRIMAESIETVRKLWRGERVTARSGDGSSVEVGIFPQPVQREPPIWVTASGSPETFAMAGRMGANVLTNLLVMNRDELSRNIAVYRAAFRAAGHAGEGHVSLMLHTYVGEDVEAVRRIVREPFLEYLQTSTDLLNRTRWELTAFAKPEAQRDPSKGARDLADLAPDEMNAIMEHAFDRYFATAGLFGTPASCLETVRELGKLGVDEIACLVDFGVPADAVLASLHHLDTLRARANAGAGATDSIPTQIQRHGVTHMQCTPTLASLVAEEPEGLAALGSLDALLLGGEALPPALADRLRPALRGRLFNMYGPTETTIWSTYAELSKEPGAPVTIGQPIANTRVHVVDRHLQPLPIGVAGEIVIGGAGVTAGYLDRPELTRERFVSRADDLLYRTGDLGRWRDDGRLEFLGRLDHQVKIRGHRVELGEIEAVLAGHAAVREAVVVARKEGQADARLAAYVLLHGAYAREARRPQDAVAHWGTIWDATYEREDRLAAGWNSSYGAVALGDEEMQAWADEVVSRIESLAPRRVLDVGCGMGLILSRVAPRCERYMGVDVSRAALRKLEARIQRTGLSSIVTLRQLDAAGLEALADHRFDTIILNSVVQYFPNVDYFHHTIKKAWHLLEPGGHLFVGDVRNLALLRAFHASVVRDGAQVDHAVSKERELLLDPAVFVALGETLPDVAGVVVRLKDGAHRNEMTRFRYDAYLKKGTTEALIDLPALAAPSPCTLDWLRAAMRAGPVAFRISGIPNQRVSTSSAIDPAAVVDLSPAHHVMTTWSAGRPDCFDLIAWLKTQRAPSHIAPAGRPDGRPLTAYANVPVTHDRDDVTAEIRSHLRTRLPDYMVPPSVTVLESFPTTPNGKIDRKALPVPGRREAAAGYMPPATDAERAVAAVWQDLLSLERISVDHNFFDLGANSLMMVQASGRLRSALGREVPVVDLFRYPTVRSLAAQVVSATDPSAALRATHDRAAARRDAMARRRTEPV